MSDRHPRPGLLPGSAIFPNMPERPRSGARPTAGTGRSDIAQTVSVVTTPPRLSDAALGAGNEAEVTTTAATVDVPASKARATVTSHAAGASFGSGGSGATVSPEGSAADPSITGGKADTEQPRALPTVTEASAAAAPSTTGGRAQPTETNSTGTVTDEDRNAEVFYE
jgi:hypothetical protein